MLQLDPPMPLETPRGKAMAHVLIDYGIGIVYVGACP